MMKVSKYTYSILCGILFICLTYCYGGGDRIGIASLSMARSTVASARGVNAIGINPSNLILPTTGNRIQYHKTTVSYDTAIVEIDEQNQIIRRIDTIRYDSVYHTYVDPPTCTISILELGVSLRSDILDYEIYRDFFTGVDTGGPERVGRYLTDSDKNKILEIFPSGIGETYLDASYRFFGITLHLNNIGHFGLTMTHRISLNLDMPKDYLNFVFWGLAPEGSHYDFSETNLRGWLIREYALNYAREFHLIPEVKAFSAGIGLKLIHGIGAFFTERCNAHLTNEIEREPLTGNFNGYRLRGYYNYRMLRSHSSDFDDNKGFTPFPSPAGKGFGIDIGVSGEVYQGVRAALSIIDIGSIRWTENTHEIVGEGSFNTTNLISKSELDSIEKSLKGEEHPTGAFSIALPTVMRIGGFTQVEQLPFISNFPGALILTLEYQQGFNSSPGNTTRAKFALGCEYRFWNFFPLRTGISIGGTDRFNWSGGFGLDFNNFNLNIGTENFLLFFTPTGYNHISFGMDMILRF